MIERLKDFFYDVSDIILSIVIIIVMVLTISWKLSDTISYSPNVDIPLSSSNPSKEIPDAIIPLEDETHQTIEEIVEENTEEVPGIPEVPEEIPVAESKDTTDVEEPVATKPSSENINVITPKEINFIIPSGSAGSSIANKLLSEGLIDDTSVFLNRLEALNLGTKLRSGTFKLSTDMDIDKIIHVLTGK